MSVPTGILGIAARVVLFVLRHRLNEIRGKQYLIEYEKKRAAEDQDGLSEMGEHEWPGD